ncbi:hypothetical protein I546_0352 [Mycobacterium kansasii 732]|nr:hypothetical protein I546_0352 [Mycobacterium kansasii 732]
MSPIPTRTARVGPAARTQSSGGAVPLLIGVVAGGVAT